MTTTMTTTIVPAEPNYYVAEFFEQDGDDSRPCFEYDPVTAWAILHRLNQKGALETRWEPITIGFDRHVNTSATGRIIKTPAGKFIFPEDQTVGSEQAALTLAQRLVETHRKWENEASTAA
jgi:hypothetical protein